MTKQDLVVIGGGVAGLVTTSVAAQLGIKVTLIEKHAQLGGDCLHYGCVPSKSLVHAAKVAALIRRSESFGLPPMELQVDLAKISARVADTIAHIQQHDDPERFRSYGARVLFGDATFRDPHHIEINGEVIAAKRFLIGTGSNPFIPPIPGLAESNYLTNQTIFKLKHLPKQLAILGGGPIGTELALCFARFGSKVTIIHNHDHLLPNVDPEISDILQTVYRREGIQLLLAANTTQIKQSDGRQHISCQTGKGETHTVSADTILVAAGQRANVQDLNLDAAGVTYSPQGIQIDKRLRTSAKHIYAAGDVLDLPYKLTHLAEYQAGVIISNAVFRFPKKVDYSIVPAVIYSDPEVAIVGMNEQQARDAGYKPQVLRFDFKDVDRAIIEHETDGLVKLLIHKNKVIGASMIGLQAGELIAEIVLAMQTKASVRKIADAIHAYPTLAQINRRVVNTYYSEKLFSPLAKRIVKWVNKIPG